jgi:hypothetical protein
MYHIVYMGASIINIKWYKELFALYIYGSNIFLCLKMKIWERKSVKVQRVSLQCSVTIAHGTLTMDEFVTLLVTVRPNIGCFVPLYSST